MRISVRVRCASSVGPSCVERKVSSLAVTGAASPSPARIATPPTTDSNARAACTFCSHLRVIFALNATGRERASSISVREAAPRGRALGQCARHGGEAAPVRQGRNKEASLCSPEYEKNIDGSAWTTCSPGAATARDLRRRFSTPTCHSSANGMVFKRVETVYYPAVACRLCAA